MHPEYVVAGEPWLDPRISAHVAALAGTDGLAKPGVRPVGLPWQEPDGGFASVGRVDLHAAVDSEGRTEDRRSDFADVYGDWDAVKDAASDAPARRPCCTPRARTRCVRPRPIPATCPMSTR